MDRAFNKKGAAFRYGLAGIQAVLICLWLYVLSWPQEGYAQYFSIYVLCGAAGIASMWEGCRHRGTWSKREIGVLTAAAVLFSAAVIMANYRLFQPIRSIRVLIGLGCAFLGGFFTAYHTLGFALRRFPLSTDVHGRRRPAAFSVAAFGSIAGVYLLYFFSTAYPGYFTPDSFDSLLQIQSGNYVNNHPFYYTMLIRLCLGIGRMFGVAGNEAVAVYGVVQILLLAAVFSYALVTLYQAGIPRWAIGVVWFLYGLLPYNLAYSATMWKDIPFAAGALLLVVALIRILWGVGASERRNVAAFVLGGGLLCLMRTNGLAVYLCTFLIFLPFFWKRRKKLLAAMALVLVLAGILTGPVLTAMGVGGSDPVEAMAIPFQQVGRVVALGREISEEDRQTLDKVFEVDEIVNLYAPESVDALKQVAMRPEGRAYFLEHLGDFGDIWLRLGRKYPVEYLRAWIEQTKGYWNGGYDYYVYYTGGEYEALGIVRPEVDNLTADLFAGLFRVLEEPVVFQFLYGIGLQVWVLIACFLVCAVKKREVFLAAVPILIIVVGLWLGTPVFAEFRYAYPVFVTVPVLLCATVFSAEKTNIA